MRSRTLTLSLAALAAAAASVRPPFAAVRTAAAAGETRTVAGLLPGEFSVTPNGAASYLIPIQVPPGTNGVAPDLTLAYGSQAPNGVLGVGWSLHGLSSIGRCPATLALDGYVGSVAFDAQDRFCLDGLRLILVEGSAYGAPGTVYHTERETWTKVTAGPACGSGPCSFVALDKDGTTLEFGTSEDSRVPIPGRPEIFAWKVHRTVDLNHNTVEVEYAEDASDGELYPEAVRYTGNTATGLSPQRTVSFAWEDRPDVAPKYIGGFRTEQTRRLASLTTAVSGETVLQYRFSYQQSAGTGRSLLAQIDSCAPDSASPGSWLCLAPTTFGWQAEANALVSPNADPDGFLVGNWCGEAGGNRPGYADFDGDGRIDLTCSSPGGEQYVLLSTGSGLVSPNSDPDGRVLDSWCGSPGALAGWGDFNGDGKADLHCDDDGGNHWVMLSNGRAVASPNSTPDGLVAGSWCPASIGRSHWINFDGEGRADLTCAAQDGRHYVLISNGAGLRSPNSDPDGLVVSGWCTGDAADTYWGDFNADGMSDLNCSRTDGSHYVLLSTGSGVESPNATPAGLLVENWCATNGGNRSFATTDFNGDGLFDLACHEADGSQYVLLATGTGVASPNSDPDGLLVEGWCGLPDRFTAWDDFNGDGLADLQCSGLGDGDQWVLLSTGTGLRSPNADPDGRVATSWCAAAPTQRLDFNGDALGDLHCPGSDGSQWVLLHASPFPDLVSLLTNGFGGTVALTYQPLTADSVYRPAATAAAFPVLDVESPLYVVAAYEEGDGRGNAYPHAFTYAGARSDLTRRIWLGFSELTETGPGGHATTTTYSQAFPANGFVLASETRDAGGELLGTSRYAPTIATPYSQVSQVLPASRVDTAYQNGAPAFTLEMGFAYDAYGNLQLTSDLGDPATPADDVFTCVRYENDAAAWQLGYERQRQLTSTEASCRTFLAAQNPVWDPAASLRWTRLDYDGRRNPQTLTAYDDSTGGWATFSRGYDDYGNVTAIDDPGGNDSTLAWDPTYRSFLVSRQTPPLAGGLVLENRYTYDPNFGRLVSAVDPNGNEMGWTLDPFGRVIESRGPPPDGSSRAATEVLSRIERRAESGAFYDEVRQRQSWDDADPANWLWSRTYLDGMLRIYQTASRGPTAGRDRNQSFLYDGAGRPWKSSYPYLSGDPAYYVVTTYDPAGRPALTTSPDGSQVRTEYRLAARQVVSIEGFGTPEARTTVSTYNARGDVVALLAANGGTTASEYSRLSQRQRQTSPIGVVSTWTYDSLGRLRTASDPDTGGRTYTYDDGGFLTWATDGAGNRVDNRFDALGRIERRTVTPAVGNPEVATYTYDQTRYANGLGSLTQLATAAALQEFAYDRYGRPAAEGLTLDGSRYTEQMGYDPAGRQVTLTYPDGAVLHSGYDSQGFLSTLEVEPAGGGARKSYATYSGYDALGEVGRADFGSGLSSTFTYYPVPQALGRLHTATLARGGTQITSRTLAWNVFGQLLESAVSPDTDLSESFTYDAMGWLRSAAGPYPAETYTYDLAGNLVERDGTAFTYPPASNRLSGSSAGLVLGYDGNGNTTSRQLAGATTTYTYDGSSNLVRSRVEVGGTGGSTTLEAVYDALGNRLKRVGADGTISRYLFASYDMVEEGASRRYTKYVQGPDGPVAAITVEGGGVEAARELLWQGHRLAAGLYDPGTFAGRLHRLVAAARALAHHPRLAERLAGALAALLALALWLAPKVPRAAARLSRRRGARSAPLAGPPETAYARIHGFYARLAPWVVAAVALTLAVPARADLGPGGGYPQPGELYFLHDQVESTVLVTDGRGNALTRVAYQPYGEIDEPHSSGPDDFRPKYTTKELDDGTGLYYFGARYQDPALGRFLQPDPADQFASPYVYVGDDPEDGIDPDGNFAFLIAAIVIGAVVGAYLGGAAVNHSYNPARWDWRSAKTYGGIFAGAAIGAVGGALGAVAAEAGVAVGILGEVLIGAGENAAFTALGGGSAKEIGIAALQGGAFGGLFGGASRALASGVSRGASRLLGRGGTVSEVVTRVGSAVRRLGGGCSSFPAGTLVATEDGPRPIEQVEVGDRVWSAGPDGGAPRLNAVSALFRRTAEGLVRVETDGETIEATPEHPFRVAGKGWVEASALEPGDRLLRRDGEPLTVRAASPVAGQAQVFNFGVERDANYFVSPAEALVHNTGACRLVPTIRGGKFATWWNTVSKSSFQRQWENSATGSVFRSTVKARLRSPGGMHEWLMVSRANKAKQWGITYEFFSGSTRSPTNAVEFVDRTTGASALHGTNPISSGAHGEIGELIDDAADFAQFKQLLRDWADGKLVGKDFALQGGADALPKGFQ